MSAHRPQPLYGPSGPVSPAHPARNAVFPTSFLSRAQVRVRLVAVGRGQRRPWWRTSPHTRPPFPGAARPRSWPPGRPAPWTARASTWRPNRSSRTTSGPSTGDASYDTCAGCLQHQVDQTSACRDRRPGAGTGPCRCGWPSSRIRAWKWTTPRRWNSATFANWTRTSRRHAVSDRPRWRARPRPQGDREPSPQLRCLPLPHQMPEVVVAVPAQRLTDQHCRRDHGRSCTRSAVRAGRACRPSPLRGRHRRVPRWPGFFAACTGPNDGAVRVANTSGCVDDLGRNVLHAARRAGHDHVEDVALVLMRARLTHRATPVPAPQIGDPVRLRRRRVAAQHLAGGRCRWCRRTPTTRIGCAQCPTCWTCASQRPRSGDVSRSVDLHPGRR